MYQKHEMETIKFEDSSVFAGTEWQIDSETGEDEFSIRPGYSDI